VRIERDLCHEQDGGGRQHDYVRNQPAVEVDRGEEHEHGGEDPADHGPAAQTEADEAGCDEYVKRVCSVCVGKGVSIDFELTHGRAL
jgi:hypothetical protein